MSVLYLCYFSIIDIVLWSYFELDVFLCVLSVKFSNFLVFYLYYALNVYSNYYLLVLAI